MGGHKRPNKDKKTFYQIKDTLSYLNSLKDKARKPYIKAYHVISNVNYHEICEMVDFAIDTGSESLEFTVIDTMPGATDCLLVNKEQAKEVVHKCDELRSYMNGMSFKNKVNN